jgi:hypothetical protein
MRPRGWTGSFLPLCLLLPLAVLAAGCGVVDTMSGLSVAKDLQNTGIPAQAEILAISETGMSINDDPVIRIDVQVRPANGQPYAATIKRLLVSRLEIPQYQPGKVIGVRFDPKDPSRVSVDLGPQRAASTGNPFHDQFTAESLSGAVLQPPPPTPDLYRGGDQTADMRALLENSYSPLGTSVFESDTAADPRQAIEQGRRIGAALIVLYGESASPAGAARPAPLPFHPRLAGSATSDTQVAPVAGGAGRMATIGSLPPQPAGAHTAIYWGKTRQPAVLGISCRPLSEADKARLLRSSGMVVVIVTSGSPALAAHIQEGDVILAIDGKPILDPAAVAPFIDSIAGHEVLFDLLRNGSPMSVKVRLNPLPAV